MEATMNKIDQQQQHTPQKPQIDMEIFKKLVENLERGQKSALMMRNLILDLQNPRVVKMGECRNDDAQALLNHHSMVCLDTYVTSLFVLKSFDSDDGVSARDRKQDHSDDFGSDVISTHHDHCSPENFANQRVSQMSTTIGNGGRKCYKMRNNSGESREEIVTHLDDDGFYWRKYGQKPIINAKYRRNYYRCAHKINQNCKATKKVQQVSDEPTKYIVIYNYKHTCNNNNNLEPSPIMIIDSPEDHPSSQSRMLSFDLSNNQDDPMLIPTSTFPEMVGGVVSHNQSPSITLNNQSLVAQKLSVPTTNTRLASNITSEESVVEASMAENYTTIASLLDSEEENYNFSMADFSELLTNWWTN